jgi:hypothetical protein
MELNGKVIRILPMVTGQGKNGDWKKQEFILETGDSYPKKVCFSIWGDKITQNPIAVGQQVTVYFDAESREYNGRWYTELKSWKVIAVGSSNNPAQAPALETFNQEQPSVDYGDSSDDLPF